MYRTRQKQMSLYDYLPPYHGELSGRNRWLLLAEAIDWDGFEKTYSELFAPGGKAAIPARIALGCRVIQLHYGVPDREVVALVRESPYLQYFLGLETFSDEMPFSARTVARFRARIPDRAVRPAVRLLRSFE
ncbi:transposase [uncultured Subdoligranulum sp.]|uniref:Transposase n=1 Tax=Candidatus Gemmiger excrementavium TaxID=2838608 RepID=A0A9D2JF43_9FIRM|nr:transposase [uncultured Subdoligranulum sp.]HIZ47273.1 transposase [Candidatus Gemmiger excrementavium]